MIFASGQEHRRFASVEAVPDTGAVICVAGIGALKWLKVSVEDLEPAGKVAAFNGAESKCKGVTVVFLQYGRRSTRALIYIMPGPLEFFLSLDVLRALALLPENFPDHVNPS